MTSAVDGVAVAKLAWIISVNFALWSELCDLEVSRWGNDRSLVSEGLNELLLFFHVKLLNKRDDCLIIRCDTLEGSSLSFVDS